MRQLLAALAATCLVLGLQGCGQTGPLYMPDEAPPTNAQDGAEGDGGPEPVN
ncbi:LPS translocon maturation chaperone LptM [Parahaliea mediterranea]|uniref:Lipoprotein n=1 Tax=Parahaliea mediterranea TaxID=651086 RepID=A0A939DIT1_9GAMM|nr:lipoprotein [Parahaliea mediterranea]MBN7798237.1 lipoprotein [Parahaliea mediterranea]